jgi:hypothetical protein
MGPNGHLAEPQTTEENDEIIKNAKTVLGYRWLNLKRYLQYRPFFMNMNKITGFKFCCVNKNVKGY